MAKPAQEKRIGMNELAGMAVLDRDGELLGKIENLSINVNEGVVESIRVRLDASLAGQALHIDLPWSLLMPSKDSRHLVLNIGLQTLVAVAARRAGMPYD